VQVNHRNKQVPTGVLRKMFRDAGWTWGGLRGGPPRPAGKETPADDMAVKVIKMVANPETEPVIKRIWDSAVQRVREGPAGPLPALPPSGADHREETPVPEPDPEPVAAVVEEAPEPEPAAPEPPPAGDEPDAKRLEIVLYAVEHGAFAAAARYGMACRDVKRWMREAGEDVKLRRVLTPQIVEGVVKALVQGTETHAEIGARLDVSATTVSRVWNCELALMTWNQRCAISQCRVEPPGPALASKETKMALPMTPDTYKGPAEQPRRGDEMSTKDLVRVLKERMRDERIEEMLIARSGEDYVCQVRRMAEEEW
jgi:hypothetical protein